MLILNQSRELVDEGARDPALLLRAAPQNGHLFLSWNATPGTTYRVRSRAIETQAWSAIDVGEVSSYALRNLTNGVEYEVELQAIRSDGWKRRSTIARATPRVRPNCSAIGYVPWDLRMNLFCSRSALDAFLEREQVSPTRLRCRNQPIGAWSEDTPECLFELPSGDTALLLRSLDDRFAEPCGYRDPDAVAHVTRHVLWPEHDPFTNDERLPLHEIPAFAGSVTRHANVRAFRIDTAADLASRATWFTPRVPTAHRYAIYHEGHGLAAIDGGAETIDWLLARGWSVIALDMPLTGVNAIDARPGREVHLDLDRVDAGEASPVALFLTPVKAVVDAIVASDADAELLLIGRSGGGWTTYVYAAIDPRIDIAVPVAGGTPLSMRLSAGPAEAGDYEQTWPPLFSIVRHEELMIAAGSRGSLHLFNANDTCCFRVRPEDAFVSYLRRAADVFGKNIDVFVDEENHAHSIGTAGYARLDTFLRDVLAAPAPEQEADARAKRLRANRPCGFGD